MRKPQILRNLRGDSVPPKAMGLNYFLQCRNESILKDELR